MGAFPTFSEKLIGANEEGAETPETLGEVTALPLRVGLEVFNEKTNRRLQVERVDRHVRISSNECRRTEGQSMDERNFARAAGKLYVHSEGTRQVAMLFPDLAVFESMYLPLWFHPSNSNHNRRCQQWNQRQRSTGRMITSVTQKGSGKNLPHPELWSLAV